MVVKFDIINDNKDNHILQITLAPGNTIQLKGIVLYSNIHDDIFSTIQYRIGLNLTSIFKKQINMIEWFNKNNNMAVLSIIHPLKKGPILILNSKVYK